MDEVVLLCDLYYYAKGIKILFCRDPWLILERLYFLFELSVVNSQRKATIILTDLTKGMDILIDKIKSANGSQRSGVKVNSR